MAHNPFQCCGFVFRTAAFMDFAVSMHAPCPLYHLSHIRPAFKWRMRTVQCELSSPSGEVIVHPPRQLSATDSCQTASALVEES